MLNLRILSCEKPATTFISVLSFRPVKKLHVPHSPLVSETFSVELRCVFVSAPGVTSGLVTPRFEQITYYYCGKHAGTTVFQALQRKWSAQKVLNERDRAEFAQKRMAFFTRLKRSEFKDKSFSLTLNWMQTRTRGPTDWSSQWFCLWAWFSFSTSARNRNDHHRYQFLCNLTVLQKAKPKSIFSLMWENYCFTFSNQGTLFWPDLKL